MTVVVPTVVMVVVVTVVVVAVRRHGDAAWRRWRSDVMPRREVVERRGARADRGPEADRNDGRAGHRQDPEGRQPSTVS